MPGPGRRAPRRSADRARRPPPPAPSCRHRSGRLAAWSAGALGFSGFGCGLGRGCGLGGFAGARPAVGGAGCAGAAGGAAAVGGGGGSGGACATAPCAAIAAPTTVAAIAVLRRPISPAPRRPASPCRSPAASAAARSPPRAGAARRWRSSPCPSACRGRRSGPAPRGPWCPRAGAGGSVAERGGERLGRGLVEGLDRGVIDLSDLVLDEGAAKLQATGPGSAMAASRRPGRSRLGRRGGRRARVRVGGEVGRDALPGSPRDRSPRDDGGRATARASPRRSPRPSRPPRPRRARRRRRTVATAVLATTP